MTDLFFLFVHGWATDSAVWNGTDTEVADGNIYRSINLPGHGGTNKWDTETLAPALREIETIADRAEDGGIIGIGWSLGAMALLRKAAKNPGLFKALVLVGTGASFTKRPGYKYGQPRGRVRKMIDGMRSDPFETVEKFYPLNFTPAELELNSVKDFMKRYRPPGPVLCTEPGEARAPGCYPAFDYAQITEALVALYTVDLRAEAKEIDLPVLIIHGTDDTVCPVEAGTALHALLKNSMIEKFEGCGHAPFITAQERFNTTVKKFVKKVTGDR